MLCTLTVTDNIDKDGVARFPMGNCPIVDPKTGDVLIDSRGRRSYTTSLAYGPSIGKNIALGYLPQAYCEEGRQRSEEHTSELQSLMRISYAVFCLKKKKNTTKRTPQQ